MALMFPVINSYHVIYTVFTAVSSSAQWDLISPRLSTKLLNIVRIDSETGQKVRFQSPKIVFTIEEK